MQHAQKFKTYLASEGLKSTSQREIILEEFLKADGHLSTEDLYLRLRKKHPSIGYATVHRTLKLFAECGLAAERQFGDGQTRYELASEEEHHDHLICTQCDQIVEFENPQIERLQEQVAKEHNFAIERHRLEIYGVCSKCRQSR